MQIRGLAGEDVVFHLESRYNEVDAQDRLAWKVKDADNIDEELFLNESVGSFYE